MKVDDLVGTLFRYCGDIGIILNVTFADLACSSSSKTGTYVKVGWISGDTTWEEWEINMDSFEVISEGG